MNEPYIGCYTNKTLQIQNEIFKKHHINLLHKTSIEIKLKVDYFSKKVIIRNYD